MLKITKVIMALILSFIIGSVATAQQPTRIIPLPAEAFVPVVVNAVPEPIVPVIYEPIRNIPVKNKVRPFYAKTKIEAKTSGQAATGSVILKGTATWYCVRGVSPCHKRYSGGLYAAAGSELRKALGSHWRGKSVTVCRSRTNCVRVKLIDWCACGGARVIDLYGDAFKRLAPLSSGVINVKIRK